MVLKEMIFHSCSVVVVLKKTDFNSVTFGRL